MRAAIRVKPGSARTAVGGRYPAPDDRAGALVVAVRAPAVDGRATMAALEAVAEALGVPGREVRLVSGATSRTKLVEVPDTCASRWAELLDA